MIHPNQFKALVDQVNAEFARLKKSIEALEAKVNELEKVKTPNDRRGKKNKQLPGDVQE